MKLLLKLLENKQSLCKCFKRNTKKFDNQFPYELKKRLSVIKPAMTRAGGGLVQDERTNTRGRKKKGGGGRGGSAGQMPPGAVCVGHL